MGSNPVNFRDPFGLLGQAAIARALPPPIPAFSAASMALWGGGTAVFDAASSHGMQVAGGDRFFDFGISSPGEQLADAGGYASGAQLKQLSGAQGQQLTIAATRALKSLMRASPGGLREEFPELERRSEGEVYLARLYLRKDLVHYQMVGLQRTVGAGLAIVSDQIAASILLAPVSAFSMAGKVFTTSGRGAAILIERLAQAKTGADVAGLLFRGGDVMIACEATVGCGVILPK